MTTTTTHTPCYIGIDVESTGLDPDHDHLLEVALVLLGPDFDVIDFVSQVVIPDHVSSLSVLQELIASTGDIPRQMHHDNGLWAHMATALYEERPLRVAVLDAEISDMLTRNGVTSETPLPLLGSSPNSIDRPMVAKYLPRTSSFLHYQTIDATSYKDVLIRTYGKRELVDTILSECSDSAGSLAAELTGQTASRVRHRALFDILVSSLQILPFIRALGAAERDRIMEV